MFPYDATILAALQTSPQSISDVLNLLHTIDSTCQDGDGLKWFNWLYMEVTQAVADRVAAGGFKDPAWMTALDVNFANLYFVALHASLSGGETPKCWRVLFDHRADSPVARIQFAMAGINAHINHDLAEAIVLTCQARNSTPQYDGEHYKDYTALNETLDSLVDMAKKKLHVRLLGDVLPPVSHLEDSLAAFGVSAARETAWLNADHLWAIRATPFLAETFMEMLDGFAAYAGNLLMVPVPAGH